MFLFLGETYCRSDHKGRVVIPVAFRRSLLAEGESWLVLHRSIFKKCIEIYPKKRWLEKEISLQEGLSEYNKRHDQFMQEYYRGMTEAELDGMGRILVPKKMLEMLGEEELVVVGQGQKILLWGKGEYEQAEVSFEGLEQLTQEVFKNKETV